MELFRKRSPGDLARHQLCPSILNPLDALGPFNLLIFIYRVSSNLDPRSIHVGKEPLRAMQFNGLVDHAARVHLDPANVLVHDLNSLDIRLAHDLRLSADTHDHDRHPHHRPPYRLNERCDDLGRGPEVDDDDFPRRMPDHPP
ncbi:unnamed protein product [Zymoseptoria tritici ST99CH_3D7]|uniref:Uncharacterized protein n=1 Tax=Zymoseptoria tritici (strain ST99CH_3D7) TaxID=1276538 RepID=A0A1X7RC19_ZYMT9|nr:unnamed protein product [Zymoseptoria tritici ST99CH_3D7]